MLRHFFTNDVSQENPCLVVCPNTVKGAWIDELDEEDFLDYVVVDGTVQQKKRILELSCSFFIISYQSLKTLDIHMYHWGSCVLDESIYISNPQAGVSKYVMSKLSIIKNKYVMCGSPAPESELQYFNQVVFVFGEFMGCNSFWSFRLTYFNQLGHKWFPKVGVKDKIYKELREKCFMLTRADAGIGSKKLYRRLQIPVTSSQRKSYNSMLNKFEADDVMCKHAPVKHLYMQKISGGVHLSGKKWHNLAKFFAVKELVKGELQGQKVLVWFKFRHEMSECRRVLEDANIKHVMINGLTPVTSRNKIRKHFWNTPDIPLALLSIKTMRAGTDWSCADTSIYVSNEFSWDLRSQSEDRLIHPKIKTPKLIIDLCSNGTIDYDIADLLRGKKIGATFFMSSLYEKIKARGAIT